MSNTAERWGMLAALALLTLVALFAYAPIFAVDFFWQLELGKLIVERRAIPTEDMFSAVHPHAPWVQFQWLWELAVYAVYQGGGLRAVRVFQVLLLSGSFFFLWRTSRRLLPSVALAFAFCALALVLYEDRFQTRPSASALGFCAALLPLWLDPAQRDRPRAWLWAGLITCLWSNVHSGESLLAPLAFAALWLGNANDRARARRDAQLFAASALGMLLCPTSLAGLRAVLPQLATGNKEFLPTYTILENGLTPSYLLIALTPTLVMVAYVACNWRRRAYAEWLLCAGLLVLSQLTLRNAFLCLIPLCALLMRAPVRSSRAVALGGCALLLVAVQDHAESYGGVAHAKQIIKQDLAPEAFPEQLAEFMEQAHIEGGAINDGRWGGYLIWKLWPRVHVFADTRQNFSAEMWPLFLASQRSDTRPAVLREVQRRYQLELAIFRGPTFPLITPPPEWQLLYKSGDQELYQHRDGAHARQNTARAQAWAAGQGGDLLQIGTNRWLNAHARELLEAAALKEMPETRLEGLLLESKLTFEVGDYAETLHLAQQGLTLAPKHPQLLYRAALCAYVQGDRTSSRAMLAQLQPSQLSKAQRARIAVLAQALR